MKLDERIKSLPDILTCFDIEKAKEFVGQKGYFADINSSYQNLESKGYGKAYGVLTEIRDNEYPFKEGNNDNWRFFIPESFLKPKSKEQENEDLKKEVEYLKEKIKFWENRYKALEDHCLSVKRFFLEDR